MMAYRRTLALATLALDLFFPRRDLRRRAERSAARAAASQPVRFLPAVAVVVAVVLRDHGRMAARAQQQCGERPFSFVVHGLWPAVRARLSRELPGPSPRLDHRIVDRMLDLMPARGLIFHEWDTHGTCSGLEQHAYVDLIRQARAAVVIPPQFTDPQQPIQTSPDQVVDAFVKANPGLAADGVSIDCDRTRLREVRICMTKDLKFRSCGSGGGRGCRSDSLTMPPVRGQ